MKPTRRSCGCLYCPVCGSDWEWPNWRDGPCLSRTAPDLRDGIVALGVISFRQHVKLHGPLPGLRHALYRFLSWLAARVHPSLRSSQ